ncbi:effector-associated constant component EACC1 [Kitasatospora sp. LaBMicrA B282]|uniref:effector-associated constant component EACC1 n=1 Tax=Kitasatospora sp. LaBMicrA B282 TaxID=3420949 RepID=UPI003D0D4486
MSVEIKVYLTDGGDISSLHAWLEDVPQVVATPVPSPSRPGEQGGAWDFLSVLCGTGGAVTVTLNALTAWIESKTTQAKVKIGEVEVELRGPDPEALARLMEAASKAAEIKP